MDGNNKEIAVFGGGCFWCTEAVFKMLRGVDLVVPGYAGGTVENPTYEQVMIPQPSIVRVMMSVRNIVQLFFRPLQNKNNKPKLSSTSSMRQIVWEQKLSPQ